MSRRAECFEDVFEVAFISAFELSAADHPFCGSGDKTMVLGVYQRLPG